ncbi:OFA family MFS transporter [Aminipila butyrica]|uniref:OFA family MFS transporter n=1 Tax=Aminipila butyrica TaxID=433296 RepID=A0A858BS67_9FIRM|nr:OFA family MFS transporter [Aminipila butyrica]QIB67955.1 OFA family MFS transporter [Aminipila butyrica]
MDLVTQKTEENRVLIFSAAFIVIFCCSASAAFSVFSVPLQNATGANAAQVALTLTIYQSFMALFGIISGKIVDRFGPRMLMYAGGLIFGLGWLLTAFVNTLPLLYLTCGFIAGAGNGLLYNPSINTALKWYPEKRGTMSGILLGSASLGPLVLAKAGALLCEQFGTKGFIYIGLAYWILIWLVGWKMKAPEAGWKPAGFQQLAASGVTSLQRDFTPGEMLRTGKFWLMLVLFAISCTSGIMMIGSLSKIAQIQLAITPLAAANFVAINCLSNFCGRLIVGRFCDKTGELKTLLGILVVTIIGLFGLRIATTQMLFIFFLILLGASFGGVLVVFPPLTSKTFGVKNFGINYGIMFFAYAIGSLVGPQIAANAVNDSLGVHAYSMAYIVAIGVAALGILVDVIMIISQSGKKAIQ